MVMEMSRDQRPTIGYYVYISYDCAAQKTVEPKRVPLYTLPLLSPTLRPFLFLPHFGHKLCKSEYSLLLLLVVAAGSIAKWETNSPKLTTPPPAYTNRHSSSTLLVDDDNSDHAVLYERLFAVEARLKEQSCELQETKYQLRQIRTDHQKLVTAVAGLDECSGCSWL
ncbi:hypothetical protein DFS34DRAFT_314390 [Phlyctochytrium arcticum]|nr:hypothetical protein DFS34DRAFT_314390 [Phlyctochytrium arcticum]